MAKKNMKKEFEYRSYEIANEDGRYSAKSLDGEPAVFTSSFLLRIIRCVDVLWDAIEMPADRQPSWIRRFINNPTEQVNVDVSDDVPSPFPEQLTVDITKTLKRQLRFPSIPECHAKIAAKIGSAAAALAVSLHSLTDMLDPIMDAFDVIVPALA
jgi:hypothetical protein